jgi:hypothetical protein
MQFCSACGFKCDTESKFCRSCGSPLDEKFQGANVEKNVEDKDAPIDIDIKKVADFLPVSYIFSFFCDLKGYNKSEVVENFMPFVIGTLLLMGLVYWLVSIQGLKKNKPNYIIGGLIGFGIIFVFGRISEDFNFAKYNAFDWLGIALNLIQIFSMYYVYAGIKKYNKTNK